MDTKDTLIYTKVYVQTTSDKKSPCVKQDFTSSQCIYLYVYTL